MSPRLTTLVATLAVLTGTAYAEDQYQWEVSGSFDSEVTDTTPDETTVNALSVSGTYYFAPVRLGGHPYEEAAFLERASSVGADLAYVTLDDGTFDASGPGGQLRGRYAAQDVPVAVDAAVTMYSLEDSDNDTTIDNVTVDVRVGYWIQPTLIAGLGFTHSDDEVDLAGTTVDTTDQTIYAYGKYVTELNADLDLNVEATAGMVEYDDGTTSDSNLQLGVSADVYFQQVYGIGASLATESGDVPDYEGLTIGVDASAWFSPQIGVRAGFEHFSASDDAGDDSNSFSLEVAGRF